MCGEYVVFGKIIAHSGMNDEGWNFLHLDMSKMNPKEVIVEYNKVFELDENEQGAEPYLFIFSHFS